jgi:hypothetical protein
MAARAYLVIAELAFAVILLVNAALLGKSLYRLLRVDTGLISWSPFCC